MSGGDFCTLSIPGNACPFSARSTPRLALRPIDKLEFPDRDLIPVFDRYHRPCSPDLTSGPADRCPAAL